MHAADLLIRLHLKYLELESKEQQKFKQFCCANYFNFDFESLFFKMPWSFSSSALKFESWFFVIHINDVGGSLIIIYPCG